MATSPATNWPGMLGGVLSASTRVVSAHSRHFLALSVLFLLPLSLLLLFSPSLLPSLSPPLLLLRHHSPLHPSLSLILLATAALLLLLAAAAAITASAHRGFFGRPVRLLPALLALPLPILRLLLTILLAAPIPLSLIALLSLILSLSPLLLLLLLPFQIAWSLAPSIVIVESSCGFRPLHRSAELIAGMRWAVLVLNLSFICAIGVVLWGFSLGGGGEAAAVIVKAVVGSAAAAAMVMYWMVASTVMYMYCKALRGELEVEIAREFAWHYVCLPFDEQKVPHVVSVG